MQPTASVEATTPSVSRHLPILLLLFAGSGCSALIYEVAWYQVLQLALGSTAVSLGILLATFMGGLCIGSIALPRLKLGELKLAERNPLRIYAALEFGIAFFGVAVTLAMPLVARVYIIGAEHGMPGMLLRGAVAAVCMLPSTILMGASLPAIVRGIESTPRGVSWWALLYGSNTAGAVFGCLFAGFYLLRIYSMATAAYVAVAINILVAVVSFFLAGNDSSGTVAASSGKNVQLPLNRPVYLAIALSGACALGAEVIWTRLMGMLLLATVYVFSIILAVFLVGLAAGGAGASWLIRKVRPQFALGVCQLLLALAIAWTAMAINNILPFWSDAILTTTNPWEMFRLDLLRCIFAILPPSLLWGASFPLACAAAVSSPDQDPGRVAGGIYAVNTLGGIVGALAVSLVLIPWIGTQQTTRIILILSAASAFIALLPLIKGKKLPTFGLLAAMAIAGILAWGLPGVPGELIAYGRRMALNAHQSEILYVAEGRNSSVAISRWEDGTIYVNVNGHVEATTEPFDMKLQRMVGHLPGLIHPNPKSVLGIGFGAGVSAGTFTRYPGIEKITVCEIEPVIPPASIRYFARQDYDVYHNPRTHIVYDDARHYLLTTTEKFDVIASDPLDVFVKGTAALYSKEYFEAVKSHLNPGGMFSLYVPLYETDEPTIRSELETFFQAFPNATVWANTRDGLGYDMVFMGQAEPLKINLDEVEQRLERADYAPVAQSLRDIGIPSTRELFATYTGQKSDLGRWTKGAQINRDADLRLSYLAGWGINSTLEDYLYREMLEYRQPPVNMFTGSPARLRDLYIEMARESSAP